jgi:hypothetical protein
MLLPGPYPEIAVLLTRRADKAAIEAAAKRIRRELNPHPAGQISHNTPYLAGYLEPLLTAELAHLRRIRIGAKALTYWPYKFIGDP